MSSPPIIVFVHGAWHSPACFHKVISILEPLGYTCISVALPSVGAGSPRKNIDDDSAAVRTAVIKALDDGNDVVVAMHSYGGAVGNNALEGLSRSERALVGQSTGVIRLFMMCAFLLPEDGENVRKQVPPKPWWNIQVSLTCRSKD